MSEQIISRLPLTAIVSYNDLINAGLTHRQVSTWVEGAKLLPVKELPIRYQEYLRADVIGVFSILGKGRGRTKGAKNKVK